MIMKKPVVWIEDPTNGLPADITRLGADPESRSVL